MPIHEISAKGILQKSGISDYAINPYTGCVHGCVYCYARFMKRFTNHPEPWGTFLDAKINTAEVLKQELERRRAPLQGEVFLSSVTDPYQPAERRYQLTRRALELLLEHQVRISILTKSDLVVRDLDLLTQFEECRVGLSLGTIDDNLAHLLEPRAAAPSRRVEALRKLHAAGVYTYAFISPFLPEYSDLEQTVAALEGAVDEIGVEAINLIPSYWAGVEAALKPLDPQRLALCSHLARDPGYWRDLEARSRSLASARGWAFMGFFQHGK